MSNDLAAAYQASVAAMAQLASDVEPAAWDQHVPATPEWTARQVLAHAAGVCGDFCQGNMAGAPGEDWTAAHVAAREGRTVQELLDEIEQANPQVVAAIASGQGAAFAFDRATHVADLYEAFGKGQPSPQIWEPILAQLQQRFPEGVSIDPYEQFRAAVSRRSRSQIRAWNAGFSDEQIEQLGLFGARDDDQPIP